MCNIDEYHLKFRGWTLCQNDMTATCPHGFETEVDGDAQDGCKSILFDLI